MKTSYFAEKFKYFPSILCIVFYVIQDALLEIEPSLSYIKIILFLIIIMPVLAYFLGVILMRLSPYFQEGVNLDTWQVYMSYFEKISYIPLIIVFIILLDKTLALVIGDKEQTHEVVTRQYCKSKSRSEYTTAIGGAGKLCFQFRPVTYENGVIQSAAIYVRLKRIKRTVAIQQQATAIVNNYNSIFLNKPLYYKVVEIY